MKKIIILIFTLLISFNSYGLFGWFDKYDSYGECMYDYKFLKEYVNNVCPKCNDWQKSPSKERAKDKKASKDCLKYLKAWE